MPSHETIDIEVEEISTKKAGPTSTESNTSNAAPSPHTSEYDQQGTSPFPSSAEDMPDLGDLKDIFNGMSGMNIPDLSKLPGLTWRQRLSLKFLSLSQRNSSLRFLRSKWSIPLWGVLVVLFLVLAIFVAVLFGIYKILRALINVYTEPFKRNG